MKKSPAFSFSLRRMLLGCLVGCLFGAISAQADESRLIVTLKDVRDSTGQIRASIYREPETFRKEDRAVAVVSVPAQKGDLKLAFLALPPGRYAIMAYHDADSDSKLGLRFGMFRPRVTVFPTTPKSSGHPSLPTALLT
jgi:uncharacterized protein (DUF2141 family)